MLSEFALIDRYFRRPPRNAVLGIGDDAAILRPTPGTELLVSTDMLVAGTHFLADADPKLLGWKALAVNLSDLAAMGAQPRWALLALALPQAEPAWLEPFSHGLRDCADQFDVDLIGGDTTRGPLNLCVTVLGEAPASQALRRSGARPGHEIWVSGTPGRAALGLAHLQRRCRIEPPLRDACLAALHQPQPRVALGLALRGVAGAAIDISDGLLADLGHILVQSGAAAELCEAQLPNPAAGIDLDSSLVRDCLLAGGDDYELLFTAPVDAHDHVLALAAGGAPGPTQIGRIVAGPPGAIALYDRAGQPVAIDRRGFDHFG